MHSVLTSEATYTDILTATSKYKARSYLHSVCTQTDLCITTHLKAVMAMSQIRSHYFLIVCFLITG